MRKACGEKNWTGKAYRKDAYRNCQRKRIPTLKEVAANLRNVDWNTLKRSEVPSQWGWENMERNRYTCFWSELSWSTKAHGRVSRNNLQQYEPTRWKTVWIVFRRPIRVKWSIISPMIIISVTIQTEKVRLIGRQSLQSFQMACFPKDEMNAHSQEGRLRTGQRAKNNCTKRPRDCNLHRSLEKVRRSSNVSETLSLSLRMAVKTEPALISVKFEGLLQRIGKPVGISLSSTKRLEVASL